MRIQDYNMLTFNLEHGFYWIKVEGLGWIVAEWLPPVEAFEGHFYTHKVDNDCIDPETITRILPGAIECPHADE